jgi:hypothetical protein
MFLFMFGVADIEVHPSRIGNGPFCDVWGTRQSLVQQEWQPLDEGNGADR